MSRQRKNTTPVVFAYVKQSERVGIIALRVQRGAKSLFMAAFTRLKIDASGYESLDD